MVLKLEGIRGAQRAPQNTVGGFPPVSDVVGVGWGPRVCPSACSQVMLGLGTSLQNPVLQGLGTSLGRQGFHHYHSNAREQKYLVRFLPPGIYFPFF